MFAPPPGVVLDDARERVQLDALWEFLSSAAYWGRWRSREVVAAQLDAAWRVAAAYDETSGVMIAFARAVSDGYAIAYLADVYVLETFRGRGIALSLVDFLINEGPGAHFRWMLHTADAHGLYEHLGFARPDTSYLERPPQRANLADPALREL